MRMLVIAPLPPPITGHSLASRVLVDALRQRHEVEVVDLSPGSRHDGRVTALRLREVARILGAVRRGQASADAIYLTIAESLAGNVKDLAIYAACARRPQRVVLHLHGGTIGQELFARRPLLRRANALFIRRMGAVIVTGPSHQPIFEGLIARDRVHIVPNFATDDMFIPAPDFAAKWIAARPLRVLYLSAMTAAKGCLDLLQAYGKLPNEARDALRLDFAGRFESVTEEQSFRERIRDCAGIHYHGLVEGEKKRRLFAEAHVFCLPTAMREGQPLSILEAYAAGCAVITTGRPGIRDVFADGINGFQLAERTPAALIASLSRALQDVDTLRSMAGHNRETAEKRYRAATFTERVGRILEARHPGADH